MPSPNVQRVLETTLDGVTKDLEAALARSKEAEAHARDARRQVASLEADVAALNAALAHDGRPAATGATEVCGS